MFHIFLLVVFYVRFFFLAFISPALSETKDDNANEKKVSCQMPLQDIPALTATFNRHKYYSKLVHHSDDRLVSCRDWPS